MARYYDRAIELVLAGDNDAWLLDGIDCGEKLASRGVESLPDLSAEFDRRTLIVVHAEEDSSMERFLGDLHPKLSRTSRVAVVSQGPFKGQPTAGWQKVRVRRVADAAKRRFGLVAFIMRLLRWTSFGARLCRFELAVLRPVIAGNANHRPSLSIIIPARNERDNIGDALRRLPGFRGANVEVIFVEGHSADGTWEEIERVVSQYQEDGEQARNPRVRAMRQPGCGKADAVRAGLKDATGDIVTILDADLTMPPERLIAFYDAYYEGRGDFINGDRLSLPMEPGAMRPLNKLGNRFFAWVLSGVLDVKLHDALCGTKLFARHDYARFVAWRAHFGERDPFGDFDLLFPAAALALGCENVPIRYAARTYGRTNIHRFRDGARLLAMTLAGWWYLKVVQKI